jgi:hypothetical protein
MREDDGGPLDGEDERSGYVSPAHSDVFQHSRRQPLRNDRAKSTLRVLVVIPRRMVAQGLLLLWRRYSGRDQLPSRNRASDCVQCAELRGPCVPRFHQGCDPGLRYDRPARLVSREGDKVRQSL